MGQTQKGERGHQSEKVVAKAQNSGPKVVSPTWKFKQGIQGYKYLIITLSFEWVTPQ
jgi:hypothetical protein